MQSGLKISRDFILVLVNRFKMSLIILKIRKFIIVKNRLLKSTLNFWKNLKFHLMRDIYSIQLNMKKKIEYVYLMEILPLGRKYG
jgi:hypothetical protein